MVNNYLYLFAELLDNKEQEKQPSPSLIPPNQPSFFLSRKKNISTIGR